MGVKLDEVTKELQEILKKASLEAELSIDAMQKFIEIQKLSKNQEEEIASLKKQRAEDTTRIIDLENKLSIAESKIRGVEAKEEELKKKDMELVKKEVHLSYHEQRGDEIKEILGMVLKNPIVRTQSMINEDHSNENGYRSGSIFRSETITEEKE